MWLWACELHELGFRKRSARYWQCERRHGLPAGAYLSLFVDAADRPAGGRERFDVGAFHVTFPLNPDRVHFYYHEAGDGLWEPSGHTSSAEIRRYPVEPAELRAAADRVAARLAAALGAGCWPVTATTRGREAAPPRGSSGTRRAVGGNVGGVPDCADFRFAR